MALAMIQVLTEKAKSCSGRSRLIGSFGSRPVLFLTKFCRRSLTAFRASESGAALVLFALLLLPTFAIIGVAIDLGQALVLKQRLINAADAAALAVGRRADADQTTAQTIANSFIRANYPDLAAGDLTGFTVAITPEQVDVTVTASLPTTFLQAIGQRTLVLSASSRALRTQRKLEVVLVLDNTGSMAGTKLTQLKAAATKLVDILFGTATVSTSVKIALVPFSASVNLGTSALGRGWLDETGANALTREDIDLPAGTSILDLYRVMSNTTWSGCIRERVGPNNYDITDEPPDRLRPETLWVPYFAPDEPGAGDGPGGGYYNDYLNDNAIAGSNPAKQRNYTKYIGASVSAANRANGLGPSFNCPPLALQRLSNDKTRVVQAINSMVANGSTVIPTGLVWGWRALSPRAPFADGAPYTDKTTVKAIVLLTDGTNDVGDTVRQPHNYSYYSSYGFAASGHLGSVLGSQSRTVLDQKTATLCSTIKADKDGDPATTDIYLYTIGLGINDAATRAMLQTCATPQAQCPGTACFFDSPSPTDLDGIFRSIALGLSDLRLAK